MSNKVPLGWSVKQLENELDILSGYPFKSEKFTDDSSKIGLIRIRDLSKQNVETFYDDDYSDEYVIQRGDILIGMDGDFNIVKWKSRAALLNQRICKIKARKESRFDTNFLFYSLAPELDSIHNSTGATTVKHLSVKDIRSIEKPFPPFNEQQKIASILTAVDDVIESTQAQINKLKDLKTGMMQELLTKGIGHTEFKDSPLGRIPKGWTTDTLSGCSFIKNNLRKPINKEERELMRGIYPYYGPTKAVDFINEFRVEGEYVLIGEDGDHFIKFATWAMTQFVAGKFNVNNHSHIIKGTDRCRTKWIYFYFMHRDITVALTRQGATRYKLNKASLEELELAIPDIVEQDKIISIFDALMEKLSLQEQKIIKLNGIKKSLMQDLLTGKVRVN
jgi:type I restriction enzyme S subunit